MAGQTSRENGMKGGRPRGFASLAAERMRVKVSQELEEKYEALWRPQFKKAEKGDTNAFKEIREFAFGKPRQNMGLDGGDEGEPIQTLELTHEQYRKIILGRAKELGS